MMTYRQTYRADKITFSVTYWDDTSHPQIHKDCTIRDKKNWICNAHQYPVFNQPSMADGEDKYYDEVTWYKWWWIRFLKIGGR
jgi:hypothetical protein